MESPLRIKINAQTRLKVLLDAHRDSVIERLIQLNGNFSKLRNPVMRNLLARRVSIADACKVGKCTVEDFLKTMEQIGFVIEQHHEQVMDVKGWAIDFSRQTKVFELDARNFLAQNKDPLKDILQMANQLEIGERLKVINSFEPVPLIYLLADQGFLHHTEVREPQLVFTWFEKTTRGKVSVDLSADQAGDDEQQLFNEVLHRFPENKIRYIDVRQLQMPEPMLQILAALECLEADGLLYVHHKKLPVYLLPELKKRGLMFVLHRKSNTELDLLIYRS